MSNQKKSIWLGFIILLVVVGLIIGYSYFKNSQVPPQKLTGFVGGEKINFLKSEEVQKILNERYNLDLDIRKSGSLDMVRADHENIDYLWPSSQTALELYKADHGKPYKEDMIFTTPIVIYSYKPVAEALVDKGLAQQKDEVYTVDLAGLVKMVEEDKKWSDLGLDLYGDICIHTTDPAKSNSGNMFSGLVANMLNKGKPVQAKDVAKLEESIRKFFDKLGYMSTSSSDLFSLYLRNGMGDKTITAGYENQLLEFSKMEPEEWAGVKDRLVILYPEPTVWSSHQLIALNENGAKLLEALKDPEIQKIAWEEHGFRTTVSSIGAAVNEFNDVPGVAEFINKIMPMPDYQAMSEIIKIFE